MDQDQFNNAIENGEPFYVRAADVVRRSGLADKASSQVMTTVIILVFITLVTVTWNVYTDRGSGLIIDPDQLVNFNATL